jgi:hypothetical protein
VFGTGQTKHVRSNGHLHGPLFSKPGEFAFILGLVELIKSILVFYANSLFPSLISCFCSSESSTLLLRHAASRLSKKAYSISTRSQESWI